MTDNAEAVIPAGWSIPFEAGKNEGMLEALEMVTRVGASLVSTSASPAELEQAKGANLAAEILTAHLRKRMKK